MPNFTICAYNLQWMNSWFSNNVIKDGELPKAEAAARVLQALQPDLVGISEGANSPDEHAHFLSTHLPGSDYKVAMGVSRGAQNLLFYYREPFRLVEIDPAFGFYDPWLADLEEDGLKEQHRFERKPLEAVFRIGEDGPRFRAILLHTKSKGIFDVVDFHRFQEIALANRKRLIGQALRMRERIEELLNQPDPEPLIIMGDLNDGPGLDPLERKAGMSFVETLMGPLYFPAKILHNTLYWMQGESATRNDLWTAEFPDPIVDNSFGRKHRVWIDHILVSPDMLDPDSPLRLVERSGRVGDKNADSRQASDHFPVLCQIQS